MDRESVYTSEDLSVMQAWPIARKIQVTQTKIMEWDNYWHGKVCVSFSGGKDSSVLLDLVRRVRSDISAVFIDTGLEYPEIRQFVKTFDNVAWIRPEITFSQTIEKYGYPVISKEQSNYIGRMRRYAGCKEAFDAGIHLQPSEWLREHFYDYPFSFFKCMLGMSHKDEKAFIEEGVMPRSKYRISKKWWYLVDAPFKISDECCNVMKKRPVKKFHKETGLKPILATMADESILRKQSWLKTGCNGFNSKDPKSQPMSFWTEQDVLRYLKITGIPYASVYGDIVEDENGGLRTTGCKRTGCMGCLYGCHLEKSPNRLQQLKITHPKVYEYLIDRLDYKTVCDYIGIEYM